MHWEQRCLWFKTIPAPKPGKIWAELASWSKDIQFAWQFEYIAIGVLPYNSWHDPTWCSKSKEKCKKCGSDLRNFGKRRKLNSWTPKFVTLTSICQPHKESCAIICDYSEHLLSTWNKRLHRSLACHKSDMIHQNIRKMQTQLPFQLPWKLNLFSLIKYTRHMPFGLFACAICF